ncbi:hypothetical protein HY218_00010 [Candidatus Saccharibacteria bacterium]|nr:hypothetical protein [Candidatus Saccharibacteria bacterium]
MAEGVRTIQIDKQQPWVKRLRRGDRVAYDEVRKESIDEMREAFKERLGRFLGSVAEVGAEVAIEECATTIAIGMRNNFEAGIQVGMDDTLQTSRLKEQQQASVIRNFVGNWAG